MSALVERIIAARDRLRPLRMQGEERVRNPAVEATEVMADAANFLAEAERRIGQLEAALEIWATYAKFFDGQDDETVLLIGNDDAGWHEIFVRPLRVAREALK